MKIDDNDHRQKVALFRYGLIAELAALAPGTKGLYDRIRKKAEGEYVIPGSNRTRVAEETIRDWLKCYRRGGFDALLPKSRIDRGRPRALPAGVVEVLPAAPRKLIGNCRCNWLSARLKHRDVPETRRFPFRPFIGCLPVMV